MPTIRDVAKLAGVSTATVSHVINNSHPVLPATRQNVLQAIERLKYRPSTIARGLSTNITHSVAIVVADITNPFFASIVRGIEDRLEPAGYNLIVCNTDEQPSREAHYLELLHMRRVDGVIIAPTGEAQPLFHELTQQHIPLVFIDRKPHERFGPIIAVDNFAAGYIATDYLIKLGHRRIALLAREPTLSTVTGRLGGYRKAFDDHNLPLDESLVYITEHTPQSALASAQRLFTRTDRPTAVIATNQLMTLGVLQAMQEAHWTYPRDVSLICFDDNPWMAFFNPPLTAIRQPVAELCEAIVSTLRSAMHSHSNSNRLAHAGYVTLPDVWLKPQLIERASCRAI